MNGSLKPLAKWGLPMSGVFLCAGPCSAESEEQVMRTAAGLRGCALSVFRAGVWKPRTHPGCFAGTGVDALPWMRRVRDEMGFAVAVEVGTGQHVEAALKHGIDVMWIGARTTPDPFAVQEIADALKGCDVPVLVKNPVSPDLEAWLGALERIYNAGITRLGAIHRGFTSSGDSRYRNPPMWRIPIELKRRLPNLPIICDPSHMCGRAAMVFPTSQEALDLLFEGLMVEVHCEPARAWSDAAQQITPAEFVEMIGKLVVRHESAANPSYDTEMRKLRHAIDEIDENVISLLAQRMDVVRAMGQLKRQHEVSTLQPARLQELLASRAQTAGKKGLSPAFISQVYQIVHEEAIRLQEEPLFEKSNGRGGG